MLLAKLAGPNDLTEIRGFIPKPLNTEEIQRCDSPPMVDLVIQ
jgi:hypothetical protein